MTGRRARLVRLEAQQRDSGQTAAGVFEADLTAGVWREIDGGRTLPLEPDSLQGEGAGVLLFNPRGESKIILGISGGEL